MKKYDNVCIDISGLDFECIKILLLNIDINRIIFGSDGMYIAPGLMVVRLIKAVKESNIDMELAIVKILSINPAKYIFEENAHWEN